MLEYVLSENSSRNDMDKIETQEIATKVVAAKSYLQAGQFSQSLTEIKSVLDKVPNHFEALYLKAVSERYINDFDSAFATLQQLKSISPEYGRAFQEEGHIYFAKGEYDRALRAYQQATTYNPGLEASWHAQAQILNQKGLHNQAQSAQGFYDRLKALPRELHTATNLLHEGKLVKAEQVCKFYMLKDKKNVEGMRLLADIASRLGAKDEAEFLYETALAIEPKNVSILIDFVSFLKTAQKPKKALKHAEFLDKLHPNNPMLQSILAIQSLEVGDYETAMTLFDEVLKRLPNDPITLTSKGHALKTYGEQADAIASYRKAFEVKADHGEAYFSLANLKTYKFLESEIERMQQVLITDGLTLQNRANLNFSLGKAFEDKKDFQQAFEYYDEGNKNKRVLSQYDSGRMACILSVLKKALRANIRLSF